MAASVWFVEARFEDDEGLVWWWGVLGQHSENRALARTKRDYLKAAIPQGKFRVKQYKLVEE